LVVGTIPIFRGAPDVHDFIPPECFIDMRQFSGYPELRAFLKQVSPREIATYRQAMRDFMDSAAFRRFGKQRFTETLGQIVAEDAGLQFAGLSAPERAVAVS